MIIRPPQPPFTEAEWEVIKVRFLRRVFALFLAAAVAVLIWSHFHAV